MPAVACADARAASFPGASPARVASAIKAADITTADTPPIMPVRRLWVFGRALDMRKPHGVG
ncbi:hypothetical protein GCM10010254_44470 [Streptomyces chromofuscus]|nr:hypothetical protein GCM10010254_44470 [Streptomyces chromofuscus]